NGGGLRANRLYPAGTEITRRDVLAELPFGNLTFVLAITGADLQAALEQGFAKAENLTGGFPQVSGMTVKADLTRPAGERVVAVEIAGSPLDPAREYLLATNDFLARGGDGYTALKKATIRIGDVNAKLIANHVMSYIRGKETVAPTVEGRILVGRGAAPK
ncbi:MAG TPA: 5'-nucleotidase, partial [Hyphomicrobiales bacterium]|nr:5'-nucleotidase [Hyphomicrobiales bacterium]